MMQKQLGFTVLELVVSILIISILAVTAFVAWPTSSFNLKAQAEQLASDVRYVHYLAMSKNTALRVNFTSTSYDFTELNGATAVNLPATESNTVSLAAGVTLVVTHSATPLSLLVFAASGAPYLNVALTSPATSNLIFTLTENAQTATVTMVPTTGAVLNIAMS